MSAFTNYYHKLNKVKMGLNILRILKLFNMQNHNVCKFQQFPQINYS